MAVDHARKAYLEVQGQMVKNFQPLWSRIAAGQQKGEHHGRTPLKVTMPTSWLRGKRRRLLRCQLNPGENEHVLPEQVQEIEKLQLSPAKQKSSGRLRSICV